MARKHRATRSRALFSLAGSAIYQLVALHQRGARRSVPISDRLVVFRGLVCAACSRVIRAFLPKRHQTAAGSGKRIRSCPARPWPPSHSSPRRMPDKPKRQVAPAPVVPAAAPFLGAVP